MTATLDDVTKKSKREPTAEERAAEEMVRQAREQGPSLTGRDGTDDRTLPAQGRSHAAGSKMSLRSPGSLCTACGSRVLPCLARSMRHEPASSGCQLRTGRRCGDSA
jgi:hypothetical protein